MDKVQEKSIQSFLTNTELFYSLVKSYKDSGNEDKVLGLIKTQASMIKSVMEDLGVHSQDLATIRALNGRVRMLEEDAGRSKELSFKSVSQFMTTQKNALDKHLRSLGLYGGLTLNFNGAITCEFKLYSQYDELNGSFYRNEADLLQAQKDHLVLMDTYKKNFETALETPPFSGKACYGLLYTDANIASLRNLFKDYFDSDLMDFACECREFGAGYEISSLKFTVLTLDSSKAFHDAMHRD